MNLSESLSNAADYTKKLLSRAGDVIILTILAIIPIVNLVIWGYGGRIIKESGSSDRPPKLERYMDMFVNGLKALVASIIWAIPIIIIAIAIMAFASIPLLIALSGGLGNWTGMLPMDQMGNWTHIGELIRQGMRPYGGLLLTFIPAMLLVIVVSIAIGLFAITGIVHMFKTGSFGKAFAIGEIHEIISKIGYIRYLGWIVVAIILGTIIAIFSRVPVLGWIIDAFLSVLLVVFLSRSIGLLYDHARGTAPPPPAPPVSGTIPPPAITPEIAPSEEMKKTGDEGKALFCPYCGTTNVLKAKYCIKCGKEIPKI